MTDNDVGAQGGPADVVGLQAAHEVFMAEIEVGWEVAAVILAGWGLVHPQVGAVDLAALDEGDAGQGGAGIPYRGDQVLQHGGIFVRLDARVGLGLRAL